MCDIQQSEEHVSELEWYDAMSQSQSQQTHNSLLCPLCQQRYISLQPINVSPFATPSPNHNQAQAQAQSHQGYSTPSKQQQSQHLSSLSPFQSPPPSNLSPPSLLQPSHRSSPPLNQTFPTPRRISPPNNHNHDQHAFQSPAPVPISSFTSPFQNNQSQHHHHQQQQQQPQLLHTPFSGARRGSPAPPPACFQLHCQCGFALLLENSSVRSQPHQRSSPSSPSSPSSVEPLIWTTELIQNRLSARLDAHQVHCLHNPVFQVAALSRGRQGLLMMCNACRTLSTVLP